MQLRLTDEQALAFGALACEAHLGAIVLADARAPLWGDGGE